MAKPDVRIERVYDTPERDRFRVLVDRLWPRGVRKDRAALDEWSQDIAPSSELRKWYGHDPDRFDEFAKRYRTELQRSDAAAAVDAVVEVARVQPVSLVTATRDIEHSGAAVLFDLIQSRL